MVCLLPRGEGKQGRDKVRIFCNTSDNFSSREIMGLLSSCGAQASHCGGFSCGAQALRAALWAQ